MSRPTRENFFFKLAAVIMLLAFSLTLVNASFFVHVHILPDGTIVLHSHATASAKTSATHSHSQSGLLQHLTATVFNFLDFSPILNILPLLLILSIFCFSFIPVLLTDRHAGRAPPAFSF